MYLLVSKPAAELRNGDLLPHPEGIAKIEMDAPHLTTHRAQPEEVILESRRFIRFHGTVYPPSGPYREDRLFDFGVEVPANSSVMIWEWH